VASASDSAVAAHEYPLNTLQHLECPRQVHSGDCRIASPQERLDLVGRLSCAISAISVNATSTGHFGGAPALGHRLGFARLVPATPYCSSRALRRVRARRRSDRPARA
jgi:hypothetical protein